MRRQMLTLIGVMMTLACQFASAGAARWPLDIENGMPVVTVKIADKSFKFVLDTGAGEKIYLTEKDARDFPGITRTGRMKKSFDLAGALQESPEIVINDVTINGVHFEQVDGSIKMPWGLSIGPHPKIGADYSVVGMRMFSNYPVLIDMPHHQLIVFSDGERLVTDGTWKTREMENTNQGVVLAFDGNAKAYRFVLDSASTFSMIKPGVVPPAEETGNCAIDLGPHTTCRYIEVAFARNNSITPVLFNLPERFLADGIVGRDFFEKYPTYIDIPHASVSIPLRSGQQ